MALVRWTAVAMAGLVLMLAVPAQAGEAAAATAPAAPIGFPEPVFDGPTPECLAADTEMRTKLQPVLAQTVAISLPVGDVLAAVRRARTLCEEGHADRGMMLYIRVSDALANAMAIAERRAR